MSNTYYAAGGERAEKVQQLFHRIARRYDFLNDLQSLGAHRRWKRRTVLATQPKPGARVLDLCCGTGDLARLFTAAGASVTAVDFNFSMLQAGQHRGAEAGIAWIQGDALRLPFPAGMFDIVTVGYGLRNLADLDGGLREIARVLKPGGRFATLDFGKPQNLVWRKLYFGYLATMVPIMGLLFAGSASAYAYILESLKHFPGPVELGERMRELGFRDPQIKTFATGAMALVHATRA